MRINKYVASATGYGRRKADALINDGKVTINNNPAKLGDLVTDKDKVYLNGKLLITPTKYVYLLFNKPVGYVCSRSGQGSNTIYDLLPLKYKKLQLVGRLDKDSSGLILLTNDGQLAFNLLHPSKNKIKKYTVTLDREVSKTDLDKINRGIPLSDGLSKLNITKSSSNQYDIEMYEGRNRQIRRTFEVLGYQVVKLHRTQFGKYLLNNLQSGGWREMSA